MERSFQRMQSLAECLLRMLHEYVRNEHDARAQKRASDAILKKMTAIEK